MTVKKSKNGKKVAKPSTPRARLATPELPIGALVQMADWMLDHALVAADDDIEDVERTELVRAYLHASIDGRSASMPTESEFLTVIALAVAAMETTHGLTGLGESVAGVIDSATSRAAPTVCCLGGRRLPRISPHLYCVP